MIDFAGANAGGGGTRGAGHMHHIGVGEQGPQVGAGNDGVATALRPPHAQVQRQHRSPHLPATSRGREGWLVTTACLYERTYSLT